MVARSGPIPRLVLVILLIFSAVSIGIIFYKGIALSRAYSHSRTFLDVFRKSSKFSEVNSVCAQLRASPLVGVFQAGYAEVNQQVRAAGSHGSAKPTVRSLDSLSRALARAATVEVTRLERRVWFLATTERRTLHRPLRHGLGHHGRLRRHRPDGIREPSGRRPRHLGGAHHHGSRPRGGDPRRGLLQLLQQSDPRALFDARRF